MSTPPEDLWLCRGPVGAGGHVVRQGECVESIASAAGLAWETVWNHADNAALKDSRKDPFALLPGDRLHVPDIRRREVACVVDKAHRFRVQRAQSRFRVMLKLRDVPRAGEAYTLDVDGAMLSGQTDADGLVDHVVPLGAKNALLTLTASGDTLRFLLGGVDPIDSPTGVQSRLRNLGLYHGRIDGAAGAHTLSALRRFQEMNELDPTGEPDAATRARLQDAHGS